MGAYADGKALEAMGTAAYDGPDMTDDPKWSFTNCKHCDACARVLQVAGVGIEGNEVIAEYLGCGECPKWE